LRCEGDASSPSTGSLKLKDGAFGCVSVAHDCPLVNLDNRTTDRQPHADAIGLGRIDPLERVVEILDSRQDGPRTAANGRCSFHHN
jgi:hypothetical protein